MKIERMYVPAPVAVDRKNGRTTLTDRAVEFDHQQKEKEKNGHNAREQSEQQPQAEEHAPQTGQQKAPHIDVVV